MGRHLNGQGQYGNRTVRWAGSCRCSGCCRAWRRLRSRINIAYFQACGDHARLQGLLAGCRKFLFRLTIAGSLLDVFLVKPLSDFFHFRTNLAFAALGCAGRTLGWICHGTMPGAWLVQTARAHRTFGRGVAARIRLGDCAEISGCGMGGAGFRHRRAGQFDFAFLEERSDATRRPRFRRETANSSSFSSSRRRAWVADFFSCKAICWLFSAIFPSTIFRRPNLMPTPGRACLRARCP
jgi:hypothetical protein